MDTDTQNKESLFEYEFLSHNIEGEGWGLRRLHSVVFQEATNHIIYRGL